jgi:hypothetical protein
MPDILMNGQWDEFSVSTRGALEVGVVCPVPATLEVAGTSSTPKYLGGRGDVAAFPARAVTSERPVVIRVVAGSQEPFPGDCLVDLSFDVVGSDQSYLLRGIPVAGQASAPLLQLVLRDGMIRVKPGDGGATTRGLGGWCVKRKQETGTPIAPTITEVVVDDSASMAQYQPHVESLITFLTDLYATVGVAVPLARSLTVGASEGGTSTGLGGVGAAQVDSDPRGRRVLLTDMPLETGRCECLIIGLPEIVRALGPDRGTSYFVPDNNAWNELLREDEAFTSQTLTALEPLLEWLSRPISPHVSIGMPS